MYSILHCWRQTCVRSTSVLHQGSRKHRTELPGAHSRERLRHRQAPNDDDDIAQFVVYKEKAIYGINAIKCRDFIHE